MVVVLETDKVSIDVRAPQDGTVSAKLAQEGENVEVGAPLMKMTAGEGGGGRTPAAPKVERSTPPPPYRNKGSSPPCSSKTTGRSLFSPPSKHQGGESKLLPRYSDIHFYPYIFSSSHFGG